MISGRSVSVAQGVAQRGVRNLLKVPPLIAAPMIVPLFFFAAFTGALSAVGSRQTGYYSFTAFVFVFALYMAAMLVGVFTSFTIALDFESGLGNRLMLAAPKRMSIIGGYLVVALGRGVLAVAVVFGVAVAAGMEVKGSVLDIAALVALALMLNVATTLFGAGVSLRLQSAAAGAVVLIPVYMGMFLTPVFVPRDSLTAWLKTVSGINPLTALVESGRGFLAGDPVSVALAFGAGAGLIALLSIWAVFGMRKAGRG